MAEVDVLVVGAGVVGLAVARALARAGLDTVIAERAPHFGMETSARNSGVIHAGLYYAPGSLKARFCVAGRAALYAFCAERGVPHRRCGKYIVATDAAQIPALEAIRANAEASGIDSLVWREAAEVRAAEPDLRCARALFSPDTGIVDAHAFMLALLGEAEAQGAILVCRTDIGAITRVAGGWQVHVGGEPVLTARRIVNGAGLWASEVARRIEGMAAAHVPETRYARGCYFAYAGATRFRHLIYPIPEPGGLGVHLTLDLAGGARFGPDVEWIDTLDHDVPADRHARFVAAVRGFWPGIDPARLHPAYAGIRPKLGGPGEPAADFRIDGPDLHGLPGVVNLFGIESPGLTAALAIAEHVRDVLA